MSSGDNYYIEILDISLFYIHRCILPILYILGNIGNFLNILIFLKKSWRKNVCVFYFNICLLINICYINSSVLEDILLSYNINLYDSNIVLCKLYTYITYLFSTFLPTVLILASIDRLLISSQNIGTRLYSSKRLAYFSSSTSIIIWFIFYFHILIKVNIQELSPSYFICYYDLSQFYLDFVSYSNLILNCLFCLIMIVLCIFSFKNVRRIRAIPRQQRQQIRTMTKKDFQLLRCLFVHDLVYIMFSIPLSIFTVYQTATVYQTRTSLQDAIVDFFNHNSVILHHVPYCASFYIFILISKAFRQELKRIIYNICGKEITPMHEEENKQENVGRENIELNIPVMS